MKISEQRREVIAGLIVTMNPESFAKSNTPRLPITSRLLRYATFFARASSINKRSAESSLYKAMALIYPHLIH